MTNLPAVLPDAPPSNVVGQTTSITLFSTQRWWGRFFIAFMFVVTRAVPKSLEAMDRLSFISFASWSLVRDLPYNGVPQSTRRRVTRTSSSRSTSTAAGRSTSTPRCVS